MRAEYPARYSDRFGQELTSITNDGRVLSMVVRGIQFRGRDFNGLEPAGDRDAARRASFTLDQGGDLCSCTIELEMPIPVVTARGVEEGRLAVRLELGEPGPTGGIDREHLTLKLILGERVIPSTGRSGWFEDEMLDIQKQLPPGSHMKACINCAFSDYNPVGHGIFGGLACFRDNKNGYLSVKTKRDLFNTWNTMTEFAQETYLCPEFERRTPGTGYRG